MIKHTLSHFSGLGVGRSVTHTSLSRLFLALPTRSCLYLRLFVDLVPVFMCDYRGCYSRGGPSALLGLRSVSPETLDDR